MTSEQKLRLIKFYYTKFIYDTNNNDKYKIIKHIIQYI